MTKIDVDAINRNRRTMENSTIESPYVPQIEDSDSDYGERLFDNMPKDRIGLIPVNEKKR